jgi:hypothetical protein
MAENIIERLDIEKNQARVCDHDWGFRLCYTKGCLYAMLRKGAKGQRA